MVSPDTASGDADGSDCVRRRTVLQGIGIGAVAGAGLVGTVSGHQVHGKPVFCGCSQLCVCLEGSAGVLMAQEKDGGGYDVGFLRDGTLVPYPEGESPYSGNFCVSTDDDDVPDGKIIGLQVDGTRWVNPTHCAQAALEAEQEQLDSTHARPEGESGGPCGTPPCEHPAGGKPGDGRAGRIQVTWEDCGTVSVTGSDDGLEEIIVHPIRCFPGDGPCPDGVPGGRTIADPDLPLVIDDQYLAIDGEEVPYYIAAIELRGDVEQDSFGIPDDLDCNFGPQVTFEDCETVTLTGPDDDLEAIDSHLIRCFEADSSQRTDLDGSTGCPTGHVVTHEDPSLPLTLDRDDQALGDEQYLIDGVDLIGEDGPLADTAERPAALDCRFDLSGMGGEALNFEFEMDDRTITLGPDEEPVSDVTVTGTAEFGFAGWDDVGHAFISVWTQSASIETGGFTNRDAERYFDVDQPAVVTNDVEITLDVPPEVGDPESGEAIETEITGVGFFGLEDGTDPEESQNIGDWRYSDPLTLRVERE